MRKSALLTIAVLFAASCEPTEPVYQGFVMENFFPFDGARTWHYISEDVDLNYKIVATLDTSYEEAHDGATKIYTVNMISECIGMDPECVDGQDLGSYRMSADQTYGTLYWGYSTPEEGVITFDPPIKITGRTMKVGDIETTTTTRNGTDVLTFDVEMISQEHCDVEWTDSWDGCLKLQISEDGDSAPAGTWWVITNYNIVAWTPAPEEESFRWSLLLAEWESLED